MLNLREQVALSDVEQFPLSGITELFSEVIPKLISRLVEIKNAQPARAGSIV